MTILNTLKDHVNRYNRVNNHYKVIKNLRINLDNIIYSNTGNVEVLDQIFNLKYNKLMINIKDKIPNVVNNCG